MDINTGIYLNIALLGQSSPIFEAVSIFCATYLDKLLVVLIASWWVWVLFQHIQHHRISTEVRWIREGVFMLLSLFVTMWLVVILKQLFHIPRPSGMVEILVSPLITVADSFSFPSGHAAFFASIAMSIAYFKNRTITLAVILGGLLVSVGRVLVGVHTPVDILAGWVLGILIAVGVHSIFGDRMSNVLGAS